MGSNPSHFKGCDDCPVENVSWDDAQKYLAKLNLRTGGRFGYRLLSEAEWEYMARGVTRADAPSTAFWWGNEIDPSLANYDGRYAYNNGKEGEYRQWTTPVGTFKANPFGIFDVHGNVCEWVQDMWHNDYTGAPSDGTAWTTGGDQSRRVLRGGSWGINPGSCARPSATGAWPAIATTTATCVSPGRFRDNGSLSLCPLSQSEVKSSQEATLSPPDVPNPILCVLPQMSNSYCLPGRAGGLAW
jgi:formylglycine-generating enzyme required for sulfatase activity